MYKFFLFALAAILMTACNESTTIGNDLLGDAELDIEFDEDISVTSKTMRVKVRN